MRWHRVKSVREIDKLTHFKNAVSALKRCLKFEQSILIQAVRLLKDKDESVCWLAQCARTALNRAFRVQLCFPPFYEELNRHQ